MRSLRMRKLRWAWVMGLRLASGGTMDIILMLARLTATTGLIGLQADCLSAPVHGMAGDALGVGAAGAGVVAAASTEGVVASTAEAVEGSMVAVDTDNCKPIRNSHVR